MDFDAAFTRLLGNEGGYVNDARDTGGETNFGVTKAVALANGYTGAMADLPQATAKAIYYRSYWLPIQADVLPADCRFDVFDAAVNSGCAQAIKWLQRAVGVTDDGVFGPATLAAAKAEQGTVIAARFNGQRLMFMTGLKTWSAFGGGWSRRIAKNLMAA